MVGILFSQGKRSIIDVPFCRRYIIGLCAKVRGKSFFKMGAISTPDFFVDGLPYDI